MSPSTAARRTRATTSRRWSGRSQESLDLLKGRPPILDLAATMALEHFTAIIAHELLANPRHLANADQATADLWRWHAVEEIEHKGVAYDTWLAATKDWTRYKRWKVKSILMLLVTRNFVQHRTRGRAGTASPGRHHRPSRLGRRLWAMWGRPGMFRKVGARLAELLPAPLPPVERG